MSKDSKPAVWSLLRSARNPTPAPSRAGGGMKNHLTIIVVRPGMKLKTFLIIGLVMIAAVAVTYRAQETYKYSCDSDVKCYPCTRWMNCVSEDFYLQNAVKCRIGGEENISRIVCGCQKNTCVRTELKADTAKKVDAWVPQD